jgi:hypothetical protein
MATVLNSWKEIATYLDRGVRTVQRWERFEHLPVHRVGSGARAPVFAFSNEIEAWQHAQRSTVEKISRATALRADTRRIRAQNQMIVQQLRDRVAAIESTLNHARERYEARLSRKASSR